MTVITRLLLIIFAMLVTCGSMIGQVQGGGVELCLSESVDRLNREFVRRNMSGSSDSIEKSYRRIIASCPNLAPHLEIEAKLRTLTEEWCARSFFIARYYLIKYWETGRGLNGARSRFNAIVERAPAYSRIDEVRMWVEHISQLSPSNRQP